MTEAGKVQAQKTAEELASVIDKENEFVVFWVSPKQRAQQTAQEMVNVFNEQNIHYKDIKTVASLRDIYVGPEFVRKIKEDKALDRYISYWVEHAESILDAEKPAEVKKRVERAVTYLERIARNIAPSANKTLRFICVGHEEIFRNLLEEGYGFGTQKGTGPNYAEVMEMDLYKSTPGEDARLKLTFRGQEAELGFNPKGRSFYKIETLR